MAVGQKPGAPTSSYTLVYDAWNRLIEVQDGSTVVQKNEYDGFHRRIVKSVYVSGSADHHIHYYYNERWQVVEERKQPDGGGIDPDPINQYVWHPHYVDWLALRLYDENQDGDVADTTEGEGEFYYLQDANYNVTAVAKSNGDVVERYHYSAYGKPTILNGAADIDSSVSEWTEDSDQTQSDIGNAYFYTGRELDLETGLQINRSRYYAAHLGRWINRDPIEYWGGMNMYAYVGGMPTFYVDPFGLQEGNTIWDWIMGEEEKPKRNIFDGPSKDPNEWRSEPNADAIETINNVMDEGALRVGHSNSGNAERAHDVAAGVEDAISLLPGVGGALDAARLYEGENLTGGELSSTQTMFCIVGVALPFVPWDDLLKPFKFGKAKNGLFQSGGVRGSERASDELLDAVADKGRTINYAKPGSDELRYLDHMRANANVGGADLTHILLREDPRKIEVLEEFLHGTQNRIGLIDKLGIEGAEAHVKEFMIQHHRLLGISPEDVEILRRMKARRHE